MRKILRPHRAVLVVIGLMAGLVAHAQAPAWQTAVAINSPGNGSAYANAVATDAAGNVYVAGQFSGTVSLGDFNLTSAAGAGNNGFLAKWSPATQKFSWARQLGGTAKGVAVVGSAVYVAGYFSSTASFGTTTLTSAGRDDIFVVKLLDAGSTNTVAWVQQAGGTDDDEPSALAATSSAVYVAGRFAQTVNFGATVLKAGTASNGFVAKLTDSGSTGTFSWAQQIASAGLTNATGLAVVGDAVYAEGRFEQPATIGTSTLTTAGGALAYVVKLLDAGATSRVGWVQAPTSAATSMYAKGIAVVGSSVYVTGDFTGTVGFGAQALTTAGYRDIFVAKLADSGSAGTFVWAQQAGGVTDDLGQSLAVAGSSVYVTGLFTSTASFGATTLTSAGGGDIFVSRLTDAGPSATFAWTQQAGGPGNDSSYSLALSGTLPVIVGSFNATAKFGSQAITNAALYSENAYLALLGSEMLATAPGAAAISGTLYPNPAHGTATVPLPAAKGAATLTLLDGLGRVVRTAAAPAGTRYAFDLMGLAPGLYVLQVQASGSQTRHKLLVN